MENNIKELLARIRFLEKKIEFIINKTGVELPPEFSEAEKDFLKEEQHILDILLNSKDENKKKKNPANDFVRICINDLIYTIDEINEKTKFLQNTLNNIKNKF